MMAYVDYEKDTGTERYPIERTIEIDVTAGLNDDYIKARQEHFDYYKAHPLHGWEADTIKFMRKKVNWRSWAAIQRYVVTGDGSDYEKCQFSQRWYIQNQSSLLALAHQASSYPPATFWFQSSSLREKEISEDNGLAYNLFEVGAYEYKSGLKLETTDCEKLKNGGSLEPSV